MLDWLRDLTNTIDEKVPGFVDIDKPTKAQVENAIMKTSNDHNEFRKTLITETVCVTVIIFGVKYALPAITENICKIIDKIRKKDNIEIVDVVTLENDEEGVDNA